MEIQLSYFKSWKMMLWKCCTQYASKFGKCSIGHRTGKDQFSFQPQRNTMPKNAQTTAQLHSSHTLVSSVQFSSVAQSCPTLCDPTNCSTPGLPVNHQLPEFTQTHVHQVGDAISSSVIPFSSCPQSLPASESFSNGSTLRMRWPKYWSFSFSITPSKKSQGWSPLKWTGWISLKSKGLSRVFSNTTVQKHQFFGAQLSSQSNSHIHTWLLEKP